MVVKVAVRLDVIDENTNSLFESFLKRYPKYLIYEEVSDKVKKLHYQGVIYVDTDKAYSAMKTRYSTMFRDWPKGTKSMALVKKDTYEVYISKDKNPKFIKDFTEEDIKELQDKSYKKEVKCSLIEHVEQEFDFFIKRRKENDCSFLPHRLRVDEIEEFLVSTFFDMKKHWDTGVIAKYRNYLHYKINPEEHLYFMQQYRRY